MSDDVQALLSIAQIAGIFVGFAALVSVVGSSETNEDLVNERLAAVRGVVATGVLVVVVCLLPVAVGRYGLSEPQVWRLCSAVFLALIWIMIIGLARSGFTYRQALREHPVSLGILLFVLEPAIQLPLALSVLGILPALAPAFYYTALILNLGQAAFVFAQFVLSGAFSPQERG